MRRVALGHDEGKNDFGDPHNHQNDTHHGQADSTNRCGPRELQDRADRDQYQTRTDSHQPDTFISASCKLRGYAGKGVPVPPQANLPFRHLRAGGGVPGEISCGAGLMASSLANLSKVGHARWKGPQLIILGVVLVVVGLVAGIPILETIGFLLVVVGVSLAILGAMGRAVGGRKHYY